MGIFRTIIITSSLIGGIMIVYLCIYIYIKCAIQTSVILGYIYIYIHNMGILSG